MSDRIATVLLALSFAAVVYAALAAAVFVDIWLMPLVMILGGVGVAELAWKLNHRHEQ